MGTTAREAISLGRDRFVDALRRGDAQTAASVYAADAHLLAPAARPMVGREDIRAYWQAGIDAGVVEITLAANDMDQNEGIAYETGSYVIRLGGIDDAARR